MDADVAAPASTSPPAPARNTPWFPLSSSALPAYLLAFQRSNAFPELRAGVLAQVRRCLILQAQLEIGRIERAAGVATPPVLKDVQAADPPGSLLVRWYWGWREPTAVLLASQRWVLARPDRQTRSYSVHYFLDGDRYFHTLLPADPRAVLDYVRCLLRCGGGGG